MRTTLNLDDELMRALKRRAAERGTTLTHLIEEAVRMSLIERHRGKPYRLELVTVRGDRPPDVDINDRDRLYDYMDGLS